MKKIELVVATVSGGTGRVTRNPYAEVWINCPGFPVSWENEELGLKPPGEMESPHHPHAEAWGKCSDHHSKKDLIMGLKPLGIAGGRPLTPTLKRGESIRSSFKERFNNGAEVPAKQGV
ncbi:MAG: hypothetical protein K9G58_03855 [Bacteroidales bacterium]|nr:hypothetical protein [Bacteroidales bacterium]MCF8397279.1 hypothetical protein [Bacteroidales bacterium]